MEKKFAKVEVSHTIGDKGWIRIGNKYSEKATKCPACKGEGTLRGADEKNYTCPRCNGRKTLPKGTQCGHIVVEAEVVGMMFQDVQIGIETTGTKRMPRVIFDTMYTNNGGGHRYCCASVIFDTKEEAERL